MEVEIRNFRIHKSLDVEFHRGEITLIRGDNGVGKSTIFDAIYWCLYKKGTHVQRKKNSITTVVIRYENIEIHRGTNPVKFFVIMDGAKYINDSAKNIAYTVFGSEEDWGCYSYVHYENSKDFSRATKVDRMRILNRFIFKDDNPRDYIDAIEEELKRRKKLYNNHKTIYDRKREEFERRVGSEDILVDTPEDTLEDKVEDQRNVEDTLEELQNRKDELENSLREERILYENYLRVMSQYDVYKKILTDLGIKLEGCNEHDYDYLLSYQQNCDIQERNLVYEGEIKERRDNLEKLMSQLKFQHFPITSDQINELYSNKVQYEDNIRLSNRLKIDYNHEKIEKEIEELEIQISFQPILERIKERDELIRVLDSIRLDDPELYIEFYLEDLKQQKIDLERSRSIINCPVCESNLKYFSGKLTASDDSPFDQETYDSVSKEIIKCTKELDKARKYDLLQ